LRGFSFEDWNRPTENGLVAAGPCSWINDQTDSYGITQLAGKACLSLSQFERRFLQQTGILPKYFARANRFSQAYSLKEAEPDISWLGVALQTGYEDYQHLVRDFKVFAGALPPAQAQSPEKILF
jgi:transcriptional regulator GlxA family with amidase domain